MPGFNTSRHRDHPTVMPSAGAVHTPGDRDVDVIAPLPARNPLVFLWLPFILAVLIFASRELPVSADSIIAGRAETAERLEAALAAQDAGDIEVSRSVGLMEGATGEVASLNAAGAPVEVSRSVGLMTGAPGDARSLDLSVVTDRLIRTIAFSELPAF